MITECFSPAQWPIIHRLRLGTAMQLSRSDRQAWLPYQLADFTQTPYPSHKQPISESQPLVLKI